MNQPAQFEGFEVQLGGTVYTVPRLSFKALRETRQLFQDLSQSQTDPTRLQEAMVGVIHGALLRNYPELEQLHVESNVDWQTAPEIFSRLMALSTPAGGVMAESPSGESTGIS